MVSSWYSSSIADEAAVDASANAAAAVANAAVAHAAAAHSAADHAAAAAHAAVVPHIVSVWIAQPLPISPTPQVSSHVDTSKSATETNGLTDVHGNFSAGSSSNFPIVFSSTVLVGDDDEDSDD